MELTKVKLSDVSHFVEDKISSSDVRLEDYIITDNLLQNKQGRVCASNLPPKPCSLIRFQKGDVLVANIRPYLKKIWQATSSGGASNDVLVIRANDETLSEYIYSLLLQDDFYTYVMKAPKGSKMPRGDHEHIMRYPILDIPHKKEIGRLVAALDDKIALNKKMNQKLERMAKRLYNYWFVQHDFPNKNGHPYKTTGGPMTYSPTLKREIPAGWEVKTLDEYLDCNKYSLTAKSSYDFIQYLDTSSLTENTLKSLQKYGSQAESPSRAKRIVYANDILYSTVRPQQKHYGIIKNPAQNMIASTGFAILSCKYGSEYNDMFYLFLIQEKNLIKLSAIADSNASSYPSFNPSDLLNLSICLPNDLKIIEPLVQKFSSLFSIVERNQKENQKLTALRDKLLPLLMNGQVVVG